MKPAKQPNFLNSGPSGEDLFEGKSQEKTALTIFELILAKAFPNNVIGLEGNWGSGKSNVIKMLSDKFDKVDSDYSVFTYDAWAHQEDLTRRTFLEELITQLQQNNKFEKKVDWDEELEKLLARSTTSTVEKFPKIKFYWIVIMGSFLLFGLLDKLFEDFWKSIDLIEGFEARYWKLFLLKYAFPLGLFIWGIVEMVREYREFDNHKKTKDLSWKKRLKRLFYIFSGKDLTTEEHSQVIEKEPSVRRFKEYFNNITKDLNNDGLIIVFDNMDRLTDSEKVLSLWSSIYTFFAEVKIQNVWVIIPYDRKHLAKHFKDEIIMEGTKENIHTIDNFLGKTFSTVFRIAPPVLSDWKRFFNTKFEEAFPDHFDAGTKEFVSTLFERIIPINRRTPRDIITFLNNLVALYLQHQDNVSIEYLALFALRKKAILRNPLVAISSKEFFNGEEYLFDDIEELEESLGAIVYNVDKEKANEVVLQNSIQELVYKEDQDLLAKVKQHTEFPYYFNNSFNSTNFSGQKPTTLVHILTEIEDVIEPYTLKRHWINFANVVSNGKREETKLEPWHKTTIQHVPDRWAGKIAQKLVEKARWELNKSVSQQNYYGLIHDLLIFLSEHKPAVKIFPQKTTFDPEEFIGFIDDLKSNFTKGYYHFEDFNIHCPEADIESYYTDKGPELVKSVHHWIDSLAYLKSKQAYKFKTLKESIEEKVKGVPYNKTGEIKQLVDIMKVLYSREETWPAFSENTSITYLNQGNTEESAYPYVVGSQLTYLNNNPPHNQFLSLLNRADLAGTVAPVVQHYLDVSDMLKLYFEKNKKQRLIEKLIHALVKNSYGFTQRLNIKWVFRHLHHIKAQLFRENFMSFLKFFDSWPLKSKHLEGHPITFLNREVIKMSFDPDLHQYKTIQIIYVWVIENMRNNSSEAWLNAFEKKDTLYFALDGYLSHDILDPRVSKGTEFMNAYRDYLNKLAKREIPAPTGDSVWDNLLKEKHLHKGRIHRIYDDCMDYLLEHPDLTKSEFQFFFKGLMKYATTLTSENKADDVIRKLILPLAKFPDLLGNFFSEYKLQVIEIIKSSKHQYDQDLYDLLQEGLEKENLTPDLVDIIITEGNIKNKGASENGKA